MRALVKSRDARIRFPLAFYRPRLPIRRVSDDYFAADAHDDVAHVLMKTARRRADDSSVARYFDVTSRFSIRMPDIMTRDMRDIRYDVIATRRRCRA